MFEFLRKKTGVDTDVFLPYSTDLHSHIFPGIDDGSPNTEVSLELLKGLHQLGVKRAIVTPHITFETFPNTPQTISAAHQLLLEAARHANIQVELLYAAEHRLDEGFVQQYKDNALLCFSDQYCLIENSFAQPYPGLEQIVFEMRSDGMQPILAHPERYLYYLDRTDIYKKLQHMGCLFQVNLLSFSGYYGARVKEVSHWMLDHEMVQFVGTDLHHFKHLEAIKEYLRSKSYLKIEHKFEYLLNDSL